MHITLIKTQTGFAPADPETEKFAKKRGITLKYLMVDNCVICNYYIL